MTDQEKPLASIAVFGRRHALWPVASILAQNLPDRIELILIEEEGDTVDHAGLVLPWQSRFHEAIGLTPHDLAKNCNGIFGLGVELRDWRGEGSRFFLAPSGTLPAINGVALHHVMLRAACMYEDADRLDYLLQPFRFAARAAEAGKFADPADDADSPRAMLGPTVQCGRAAYAAMLKDRVPADRARVVRGRPVRVSTDAGAGHIGKVILDSGEEISADLFVDVSGTLMELLPESFDAGGRSLSDIVAFDRIVRGDAQAQSVAGHASAHALAGGLLFETPVRDTVYSELLFSSETIAESAERKLVNSGDPSAPFSAFYSHTPWTGNIARLGPASAVFGPYLSADMRLLHEQALHLVRYIPARREMTVEATAFNYAQRGAAQQLRDFIAVPFLLNGRNDAPWSGIRPVEPPESLAIRLEQFRSRGRFVTFDGELFDRQSWIDMMIAFGIVPQRYDPRVDAMDMRRIAPLLKQMTDTFTHEIAAMPDRSAYLAKAGLA
ncbi:MAG: tryptophan 7-halogenase [Parasphingopyxis sp.]|uniref:tryptophan 7-halogenase n=1 Tax=Parasphingopyxis sp. TaxID=1920299 RepID=UPI003FA145FB